MYVPHSPFPELGNRPASVGYRQIFVIHQSDDLSLSVSLFEAHDNVTNMKPRRLSDLHVTPLPRSPASGEVVLLARPFHQPQRDVEIFCDLPERPLRQILYSQSNTLPSQVSFRVTEIHYSPNTHFSASRARGRSPKVLRRASRACRLSRAVYVQPLGTNTS